MTRALVLLASLVVLAGCTSGGLRGKVIAGDTSFVVVASGGDARLGTGGLKGARVVAHVVRDGLRRSRSEVRTDKNGWFEANVGNMSALADKIELEVTLPGHVPARGRIDLPAPDRSVLVLLKPEP